MAVTRLRDKRKRSKRPGFYVAIVRNTGVASVRDADHYFENGEEYERGVFFRTHGEAATACDKINRKISARLQAEQEAIERAELEEIEAMDEEDRELTLRLAEESAMGAAALLADAEEDDADEDEVDESETVKPPKPTAKKTSAKTTTSNKGTK